MTGQKFVTGKKRINPEFKKPGPQPPESVYVFVYVKGVAIIHSAVWQIFHTCLLEEKRC